MCALECVCAAGDVRGEAIVDVLLLSPLLVMESGQGDVPDQVKKEIGELKKRLSQAEMTAKRCG